MMDFDGRAAQAGPSPRILFIHKEHVSPAAEPSDFAAELSIITSKESGFQSISGAAIRTESLRQLDKMISVHSDDDLPLGSLQLAKAGGFEWRIEAPPPRRTGDMHFQLRGWCVDRRTAGPAQVRVTAATFLGLRKSSGTREGASSVTDSRSGTFRFTIPLRLGRNTLRLEVWTGIRWQTLYSAVVWRNIRSGLNEWLQYADALSMDLANLSHERASAMPVGIQQVAWGILSRLRRPRAQPSWPCVTTIVSIVALPAGQTSEFLESILAQTWGRMEVITLQPRKTPNIPREKPGLAECKVILWQDPGKTKGALWNEAVRGTRGKYVCCLDEECGMAASFLEVGLFLMETLDVDLFAIVRGEAAYPDRETAERILAEDRLEYTLIRKDLWTKLGGFDAELADGLEWDLAIRALQARARIYWLPRSALPGSTPKTRQVSLDVRTQIGRKHAGWLKFSAESCTAASRVGPFSPFYSYDNLIRQGGVPKAPKSVSILIVLPFLGTGGAERIISQVCAKLSRIGFHMCVITTESTESHQGDTSEWFNSSTPSVFHLPRLLSRYQWSQFLWYALESRGVQILWQAGSTYVYDMLPAIKMRFPNLCIIESLFNTTGHTANHLKHNYLIDHVIVEHEGMKQWLLNHAESAADISVIPNGVDLTQYSPQPKTPRRPPSSETHKADPFVVGFFGRLSEEKAPDLFLEIAGRLDNREDIEFMLCGDGPMAGELQERARITGLSGRLAMPGFVDIRLYLTRCDALVLCSRIDGRPNIVLESLAMGVPVIASRVGGLPEMVQDRITGILCDVGDIPGFVRAITRLADDRDYHSAMRHAARESAERNFSIQATIERYAELFRQMAGHRMEATKE